MTLYSYVGLSQFFQSLKFDDIHVDDCQYYAGDSSNTHKHSHGTFELCYFLKGQHSITANSSTVPMISRPYNLVGYLPGCEHQGHLLEPQETIVLWLKIPFSSFQTLPFFSLSDKSGVLRWFFEQILEEYRHPKLNTTALLQSYSFCIIQHIIRSLQYPNEGNIKNDILDLARYIESNFNMKISLDQMANKLNLSKSYFCRIFKETMGVAPQQYIQNLRIEQAKLLLKSSPRSIVEISEFVGYDDPHYFSRIFRQYTGMTPREWKKST